MPTIVRIVIFVLTTVFSLLMQANGLALKAQELAPIDYGKPPVLTASVEKNASENYKISHLSICGVGRKTNYANGYTTMHFSTSFVSYADDKALILEPSLRDLYLALGGNNASSDDPYLDLVNFIKLNGYQENGNTTGQGCVTVQFIKYDSSPSSNTITYNSANKKGTEP